LSSRAQCNAPGCFFNFCLRVHSAIHCTVHVNSASELHCSREQCNSLALFTYTVQWIALFACTVQVNCTVHAKTKVKKAARSCFANFTFKTWIGMGPTGHEIAFWILPKYHVCCGCFKRRSNHANKRPLTPQLCQRFLWPEHVWNRLIFFYLKLIFLLLFWIVLMCFYKK
jgi:hypothetical protein